MPRQSRQDDKQTYLTLMRLLATLELIPAQPHSIRTPALHKLLAQRRPEYGNITPRTLQRDLEKLSTVFPLNCDTEGKTNCWYWSDKSTLRQLPAMTQETALTLLQAEQHLSALMPPGALESLRPYLEHARGLLDKKALNRWRERVRIIPLGPPRPVPAIKPEVQQAVSAALLHKRQITLRYTAVGSAETREHKGLNPLALIVKDGVSYLLATPWQKADPTTYAMHRIHSVEPVQAPAVEPEGFSLDAYLAQGGGQFFNSGRTIKLELTVDDWLGQLLSERPLAPDQTIRPLRGGGQRVTASVIESGELFSWLRSFGPALKVLKPRLRD